MKNYLLGASLVIGGAVIGYMYADKKAKGEMEDLKAERDDAIEYLDSKVEKIKDICTDDQKVEIDNILKGRPVNRDLNEDGEAINLDNVVSFKAAKQDATTYRNYTQCYSGSEDKLEEENRREIERANKKLYGKDPHYGSGALPEDNYEILTPSDFYDDMGTDERDRMEMTYYEADDTILDVSMDLIDNPEFLLGANWKEYIMDEKSMYVYNKETNCMYGVEYSTDAAEAWTVGVK